MAIYRVLVTAEMIVEADNCLHAARVAGENIRENDEWVFEKGEHVQSLDELSGGWDGMCLPFGGNGSERLKDILPEDQPKCPDHTRG